jgi:hypothetical protein
MKRRCVGFKKNLNRCSRTGDWTFFCHDHKRQPIVWGFVFVFTVLGGGASIFSIVETKVNEVKPMVEPKGSTDTSEYPPLSLRGVINNENLISFAIASDVALVSLFDPMALDHRVRDKEDWWIDDSELIREMNRGNGIFISTGFDGYYEVLVHGKGPRIGSSVISMNLVCEAGLIYVGGYPNEGLEKIASTFGGDYFSCEKGVYQVEIRRKSNVVDLSFIPIEKFSRNSFEKTPHFDEFD